MDGAFVCLKDLDYDNLCFVSQKDHQIQHHYRGMACSEKLLHRVIHTHSGCASGRAIEES